MAGMNGPPTSGDFFMMLALAMAALVLIAILVRSCTG